MILLFATQTLAVTPISSQPKQLSPLSIAIPFSSHPNQEPSIAILSSYSNQQPSISPVIQGSHPNHQPFQPATIFSIYQNCFIKKYIFKIVFTKTNSWYLAFVYSVLELQKEHSKSSIIWKHSFSFSMHYFKNNSS